MKLIHGDSVIVIAGKDKGKKGTIMRVLHGEEKVVVSGVNMVTKHTKKTSEGPGRIVKYEAPLSAGKVMILDPKTGKPTRIGYRIDPASGKKVRFAKKSGTVLARIKIDPKEAEAAAKLASAAAQKKQGKRSPDALSQKATVDAGPAATKPMHTRSAGRGS
jgi:large subunit ribosomal protein L24